jgi:hypothetical protein
MPGSSRAEAGLPEKSGNNMVKNAGTVLILLIVILIAACTSAENDSQQNANDTSSTGSNEGAPVSTVGDDQTEEPIEKDDSSTDQPSTDETEEVHTEPVSPEEGWQSSAHADSYVLSTAGKNDTCARCHSPVEWLPGPEDIPESCLTCKFDVDIPDPVISEEDWEHVPCKTCHKVKDGEVEPEYVWLDIAVIEEYIDVGSPSELCDKCHEVSEQPDHKPAITLSEDHVDLDCTECHDPHSTAVNCSGSDCHPDVLAADEPTAGHDEDHSIVTCLACHDADNLQIGPDEESGEWVTFIEVTRNGDGGLVPHSSHSIQLEVECERCHYTENPWDLSSDVSADP